MEYYTEKAQNYINNVSLSKNVGEPICDKIWHKLFKNNLISIKRHNDTTIDIDQHIDATLTLSTGGKIYVQEKCLRSEMAKYDTFTIEYCNNGVDGCGEYKDIRAQWYLHGYISDDMTKLQKYCIIDVAKLLVSHALGKIQLNLQKNVNHSHASFYYIKYADIPKNCIIFKSW